MLFTLAMFLVIRTTILLWIDDNHPYPQGEAREIFLKRLFEFCQETVLMTAGWHLCPLCQKRGDIRITEIYNNQKLQLGKGQIRIFYNNSVYAAPSLIFHYVVKHKYKPPYEFIETVINGIPSRSQQYKELK